MSEFKEKYQFESKLLARLITVETSSGGSFHSSGEKNEPCWNFRLWKASLVLAMHLEDHASLVKDKIVVELGGGTGLLSILCSLFGARVAVCTDLKVALPLILHNAAINVDKNRITYRTEHGGDGVTVGSAGKCLKGHDVVKTLTESDEYICNVCEEELPESAELFSCRECNFDFCQECHQKIVDSSRHTELPTWLKCQLEATSHSHASHEDNASRKDGSHIVISEYNWNAFHQFVALWDDLEAQSLVPEDLPIVIIASDVTYNVHSTHLFFSAMDSIIDLYKSRNKLEIAFLLAHHCRSQETTSEVLRQFDARSSWKATVFDYDADGKVISLNEVRESEFAREVIVFSVTIALL
eukprot:gene29489-35591_t